MPVPCSPPSAAAAGWEAVVARAGVPVGTLRAAGPSASGLWPFGLCPKFLKIKTNRQQSRSYQAKLEGSISPVPDILSSKQSSGSDRQNVHEGRSCCLFCKKNSD